MATHIDLKKGSHLNFSFNTSAILKPLSCGADADCIQNDPPSDQLFEAEAALINSLSYTDVCHLGIYLQHFNRPQQSPSFQIQGRLTSLSIQHCIAAGGQALENQSNDSNLSKHLSSGAC